MLSDLKYALRQMAKNPGFAAVAVLTLALGIGANTAVFSAFDFLLLRSLPVRDPEQLVIFKRVGTAHSPFLPDKNDGFPFATYQQVRDGVHSLSGVSVLTTNNRSLVASGLGQIDAIPVRSSEVSGDYFSNLGLATALGRPLVPDDDRPNAPRAVVVVGHDFWLRKLDGDPAILGKTVQIDGVPFAVVGVAPEAFVGVDIGTPVDVWVPVQMLPMLDPGPRGLLLQNPKSPFLQMFGRLRPGATRETAAAESDVLYQAQITSFGSSEAQRNQFWGRIDLQPGGSGFDTVRGTVGPLLSILAVVVALVQVIACANVAGLMLARIAARQHELAVRSALGATQALLVRQLMTESMLLAVAGGLAGLLFGHWGSLLLGGALPGGVTLHLSLDGRLFAFVFLATVATGILLGLLPALRFSRIDLVPALKSQGNGTRSQQALNKALVAGQIALSVCLLAGTGLFVRTIENLERVNLGFNRENLVQVAVLLPKNTPAARQTSLVKDLVASFGQMPGVRSASQFTGGFLGGSALAQFTVDGYVPPAGEVPTAYIIFVDGGFFKTSTIPLLEGRGFSDAEAFPPAIPQTGPAPTEPVVINESLAKKFFGGASPLGRHIRRGNADYAIIGVARNTKYRSLREEESFQLYFPSHQFLRLGVQQLSFQLRTSAGISLLASTVSTVIQRVDPRVRLGRLRTMDEVVDASIAPERMMAHSAAFFSLFALMLASLGLYGVLAYNVTRRTREIGVRMALGARPLDVLSLFVRQGMGLALAGCAIGSVVAMALSRLIASRLYGVGSADPLTFLGTTLLLAVVALLACWLPARRAARVDPMIALRAD